MENNHREIKVSVIVPVYNAEKYLNETIESIENQTLKNIEVIFVDDGSTDSSADILLSYKERQPGKVTVIRQKNQYAGVARNNGLKHAEGKYVAFWDADDFSDPTQLEKLFDKCEKTGAEVGMCGMLRYDQKTGAYSKIDSVVKRKMLPGNKEVYSAEELQDVIFNAFSFHSPNKLFLRSFLEENDIRYSKDRISEDTVFIMKSLILAKKIAVVDENLYVYRIDGDNDNLTGTISGDILSKPRAFMEMKAFLIEKDLFNEKVKRSFANKALAGCLRHLRLTKTYASYKELFNYLVLENGLNELCINGDEDYFYSPKDFIRYKAMKESHSAEEYLFRDKLLYQDTIKDKDTKLRSARESIRNLKSENKKIKSSKAYKYAKKASDLKAAVFTPKGK